MAHLRHGAPATAALLACDTETTTDPADHCIAGAEGCGGDHTFYIKFNWN